MEVIKGRMYDYNNGRFLSVDPFIQAPTSTQSMNPYTYIFNNPLSGIDPTGYAFFLAPAIPYIIEAAGWVSSAWAAKEAGPAIGTAIAEVATGDKSVGDAAKDLAIEKGPEIALTAVAGPAGKVLGKYIPESAKKFVKDKVAKVNGNKNKSQSTSTTKNKSISNTESQDSIKSTSELRGKGDFKEGIEAADKRSAGKCEYCGKETNKIERDHFEPLSDGKKAINEGRMSKQEAIKKYDSKDNLVNSCKDCNRGVGGKHSKTPSTTEGAGKFKVDTEKASEHVVKKLDDLEGN